MPRRAPRGRGSVFEDKARGRWVAQLKVDGKLRRRYAASEEEAWDLREQLVAAARLGVTDGRATLAEYLTEYLASRRRELRPLTLRNYESQVRLYILPAIGQVSLTKLGPQHLRRLFEELSARGLSAGTVRQTRAILRAALGQALSDGLVTRNVGALVKPPPLQREESQPLHSADALRFMDSLRGDRLEALYCTALMLGLRQSELLGLRWRDLEGGILHVEQTLQRVGGAYFTGPPKSKSSRRSLPLPEVLLDLLAQRRSQQLAEFLATGARPEHDLVFTTPGGNPINGSWLSHDFQRRLKTLGLPRVRFHDLRHSAASLLLAEGFGPREIMMVLGHSSIALTMNVYTHIEDSALREKMGRMDDWRAR